MGIIQAGFTTDSLITKIMGAVFNGGMWYWPAHDNVERSLIGTDPLPYSTDPNFVAPMLSWLQEHESVNNCLRDEWDGKWSWGVCDLSGWERVTPVPLSMNLVLCEAIIALEGSEEESE